ncbi:MAG: hypothetical protein FWC09_01155 [Lachnospiraceae bacterium]|nr:hypothetical protein [Lachnospiraceae bacterium]
MKLKRTICLNGYMTIEASLIMPLVIGTIMFLIFSAFFLYSKCVIIQDAYIKCYRASVFTYWEAGYGEVSYGNLKVRNGSEARDYIESRSDYSRYPFFDLDEENIFILKIGSLISEAYVQLNVIGTVKSFLPRDFEINIEAVSSVPNPVSNIRSVRRGDKSVE